jgi:steroid 5-alpha reductase family enzyme
MHIIVWSLIISIGLNVLLFIPAYRFQTDKLTDLSYSVTFIVVALVAFSQSTRDAGHLLALFMVLLWAFRLGGFLFIRINKLKKDSRFDEMRSKPWSFFRFWLFQGITVFVVLAAVLAYFNSPITNNNFLSYLGWWIFGVGLALEAAADWQKYRFNQKTDKSIWIDTGFWRISRHPNYLGEIMVWSGMYIFCFSSISWLGRGLGLASPVYISVILLFFSGIPLLEKAADKKWSSRKDYQDYKKHVPTLVPTLRSLKRLDSQQK